MFKSIKEVYILCQKPSSMGGNYHARFFGRKVAVLFTWLFVHTPITPNQVTFIYILIGLISGIFFTLPSKYSNLLGAILLQLWFIFDSVDGQVARYKKMTSYSGVLLDKISHFLIHPFIFMAINLGMYLGTKQIFYLYWGIASSLGSIVIESIYVCWDSVYLSRVNKHSQVEIKINRLEKKEKGKKSILRRLFSLWHMLNTYPSIMNIITVSVSIDFLLHMQNISFYRLCMKSIVIFYGISLPLFAFIKILYLVRSRVIDDEFLKKYSVIK